jgi:hypothetical protein
MRSTRLTVAALALALPLSIAACGSDSEMDAGSTDTMSSSSAPAPSASASESMGTEMAGAPFGPGCAAVPADGAGSFSGMAQDPVATAASNNPVLSTLVTAVTEAGLGDTLNTTPDITVFAPTNDAFAAMDKATLDKAMADPKGLLTTVLTNHVVAGRLAPTRSPVSTRPWPARRSRSRAPARTSPSARPRSSAVTCRPPTRPSTSSTACCSPQPTDA